MRLAWDLHAQHRHYHHSLLSPNCEWCMIITLLKPHSSSSLERLSCEHNFLINMSNFFFFAIFRCSQPRNARDRLQNYDDDIFRMSCYFRKFSRTAKIYFCERNEHFEFMRADSFQFKFMTSWKINLLSSEIIFNFKSWNPCRHKLMKCFWAISTQKYQKPEFKTFAITKFLSNKSLG